MDGATIECENCEWTAELNTRVVHGPTEDDDETVVVNEPDACPKCGNPDLTVHIHGLRLRDEGREDFHSDG